MTSYVPCKKNDANGLIFYGCLMDQSNTKLFKSNPTLASGDIQVQVDGAAFANVSAAVVAPASSFSVKVTLSQAQINGDNILIVAHDLAGSEWCDREWLVQTSARGVDDLTFGAPAGASTAADIAAIKADTGTTLADVNTGAGALYARIGAPAGASIAADIAAAKTDTAGIKAKTDNLTISAGVVDANAKQLNGDATAAANMAKTTRAIVRCTVSGSPTTTSIPTSACAPSGGVADQFKGRIITFDADTSTPALRGQASDITANTSSATPTFTVTALTTSPSAGDTFSIT